MGALTVGKLGTRSREMQIEDHDEPGGVEVIDVLNDGVNIVLATIGRFDAVDVQPAVPNYG